MPAIPLHIATEAIKTAALQAVEHSDKIDVEQAYYCAVKDIVTTYPLSTKDVEYTGCLCFIAGIAAGKHINRNA